MKVNEIISEAMGMATAIASGAAKGLGQGVVAGTAGAQINKTKNDADLAFAELIPAGPDKAKYLKAVQYITSERNIQVGAMDPFLEQRFKKFKDSLIVKYNIQQPTNEDWNKVNKQDKTDGLSQKAVNAYRRENPGRKLKTAVTKKPSELKAGSKDAKRRKSFCARMSGNKGPMKDEKGRPTPKAKALIRWNCE